MLVAILDTVMVAILESMLVAILDTVMVAMPKKRRAARGGVSGWDRDGVGRAEEGERWETICQPPTTQPHKTTISTTTHKQSNCTSTTGKRC